MNDQNQVGNIKLSSFDNQPIGKNNKFFIPQYAQNENPAMVAEAVNPEPKPLAERLKKNIQKIRRQAVEELLGLVKIKPNQFQPHEHLAAQLLGGNDLIVMNNTLKIIVLYLNGGNSLKKDHKILIKTLVDKCLCLQKDEIKSNSEQILYWLMDNKCQEMLLSELNQFLMNKNRKIVSTSLICITALLNQYGIKRMKSLQMFYTSLELLSSPAKPVAKNETVILMKEAYRWVGQTCLTFYKIHMEIKEQIVKFGKEYQKVPMQIKRGLKKEALKPGQAQKPVYHMQEEQIQNHQPVDVLNSYTSQWVDHLFKIQKWKEKKEELDQFIKKTKVPHILPPRELSHFIFLIKKLLQENNINIFYCGLYIIQNLSKGLKKEFSHIAKNVLGELYNKLKDSKPMTVDLVHTTLLSLMHTLHLQDFIQYIKDGLNDKSPLMKEETMKFLSNFIEKKDQKIINLIRMLLDKLIQLTEDGASKVRGQALQCLCALKIAHGMKFFGDKLKKLDPKKLQTIELTKAPQTAEVMQIEQPIPPPVVACIPISEKQTNIMKIKPSKSLQQQKSQATSKNEIKNEQTSSVNSNGNGDFKVSRSLNLSCLQQISSSSEAVRGNAYQNLAHKFLSKDIKQFLPQLKNNSIKQSSPNILKNILNIAKKYINNCVADIQITQFLIKHDWKKSKQMLTDFIQANRFTQQADQALRLSNLLMVTTNKVQTHQIVPTYTLKSFCIQLQNSLITKMSSPIEEIKRQAAENMILMWQSIPKINSQSQLNTSNGWNEEAISRFFNIIKCRIIQNNVQIVSLYCRLLMEMMNKGITVKYKHMKLVAQTLGNNLSKGCIQVKKLYREMVNNAPHLMFSMMQSDICNELTRDSIVQFIVQNSELFLKFADLKAFVNPFLHILCTTNIQIKIKQSLDSLFKQMIQISGTSLLQKEVSRLKVSNIQAYNLYLSNYNVCLNKGNYQQANNSKNYHLRQDRLKYWEDEGWYGKISSSHILKLANLMTNLGEPLSGLCTLLYLTEDNINMLNSLQFGFLVQYSDVFFKFIYWRTIIDNKEAVQQILGFTSRLIGCVSYSITEIDLVLLLKSVINIVERFRQIFYNQIQSLFKKLFKVNPQFQNNTFQFFINYLMENANPQSFVDQMLKLFMGCYQELLVQNLVQLARIPTVHRNQLFMRYIQNKCDSQHLIALGFKVAISSKKVVNEGANKLLSQQGGPQNTIPMPSSEIRTYIALFMLPSVVMTQRLNELTENIDPCIKMETYTKILYSVATPFLRSQIHSINVHHFLNKLTKIIGEPYYTKKTYLRELTRMLLYLLVDLDQCPPEGINAKEYATIVNKCILTLIETSEVRHMLQILFLFEKRQIQLKQSSKITHLIIKCIGKTIKNNDFKLKMGENTLYIISQTNFILKENDLPADHSVVKSFRNILFFDLFRIYPVALSLLQEQIQKGADLHPYIIQFYKDFVAAATQIPARSQQIELPLKQHLKETHNMIRALGPVSINKVLSMKKAEMGQSTQ